MDLREIEQGVRVTGVVPGGPVEVVAVERSGGEVINLVYRSEAGGLDQKLVTAADAERFEIAAERRWSFDADGGLFRLASEARRIQLAHLFDPFTAVEASGIDPLPHQIEAVYKRLLPLRPLRFLLADDPGAGKTIMSGLYIRELVLRGDLARCLIIAPGALVEQWQEELSDKFGLDFDIFSRDMVESSRTANPFCERNMLIARLDQLSRNDELLAKLSVSEWDLVIVDEAHKMAAHLYGGEVNKTKRFRLGERLGELTRGLLLLTATPHNGKDDDFLLFLSLLDGERFGGRLRDGGELPDTKDVMRRYVKENLLTFDGTPLFPERYAETLKYSLSDPEQRLYDQVTEYVRNGMNRAYALEEGGDRRRGLIVGFALAGLQRRLASSPAAIHESLRRRMEKVERRLAEAEAFAKPGAPVADNPYPAGVGPVDFEDFDYDDYNDLQMEDLEEDAVDAATAELTAEELQKELAELRGLEGLARQVRESRVDQKWRQLSDFLQSDRFADGEERSKLIVFTEHKDTLVYLTERIRSLLGRAEAVVNIHGGMKREERRRVQDGFRNDPEVQVLAATDAAGEGVNLQRANMMVNYDIPWNPNRIEQRFGRIHRIGQKQPCFLWNLVAHETREGRVLERLFHKIEQQRRAYGGQVYDILGDAQINKSLQKALLDAIRYGDNPVVMARMEQVIDAEIGQRFVEVLQEQALAPESLAQSGLDEIRYRMEYAKSRKLQPGFVEAFFLAALDHVGGRAARREKGRFQVARVPAAVRSREREAQVLGQVQPRYERIAFDKAFVEGPEGHPRAELIAPGHPLLSALIKTVLEKHGAALRSGATLVDETDPGRTPRVLVYLDHTITDGRSYAAGQQRIASRRFHFVEVGEDGKVGDPGADPYLNYRELTESEAELVRANVDHSWAEEGVDTAARGWAMANLAEPHYKEIAEVIRARVERVRKAVRERLNGEIQYWDLRAIELREQENRGRKQRLNYERARRRAENLAARKERRLRQLAAEGDLSNKLPNVVAAALIIPQGLLDALAGAGDPTKPGDTERTNRLAVDAVLAAECSLGREPEEQTHSNPGFDILSRDPTDSKVYQIEVKGHLPTTTEIKVSAAQVRQAKQNPDRFRLAVVEVPEEPTGEPVVHYLLRPFDGYELHFAQTHLPLKVADLRTQAAAPR